MKVAVVGSGLSGLTAGAYLAQAAHTVTVFEQFDRPGGVTAPYERDGFHWDLGQLMVEGLAPEESWRVPHKSPVEDLWFVGAQSESGGGVNNVMPGAYRIARRIAAATVEGRATG
jgi:phytoene dehydrogenase-like protein